MYSEPAVECGLVTDEVVNQRRYGALPLSYGAASTSGDGGIRTGHRPKVVTPGSSSMYSNSAVGHIVVATKGGQS